MNIDRKTPGLLRWVRMRLRRADGGIYLDRWGFEHRHLGGIFVHRMTAPDPGQDLHDHPWVFWSLVLWGGYQEERCPTLMASVTARIADRYPGSCHRGYISWRRPLTIKRLGLDECHRITDLGRPTVWTLIVHGPHRTDRQPGALWGFWLPSGWVDEHTYDQTVRVERRDLWNEAV